MLGNAILLGAACIIAALLLGLIGYDFNWLAQSENSIDPRRWKTGPSQHAY